MCVLVDFLINLDNDGSFFSVLGGTRVFLLLIAELVAINIEMLFAGL